MIDPNSMGRWRDLDGKLRPFVARRVTSPHEVDDVVQDVFLRMQRGLSGLREEDRFGPWVYRIARNAIADHRRDVARHVVTDREPPEEELAPVGAEDDSDAEALLAAAVAPFVAMLPSPYREALTLTEIEGITQADAAAMLGITVSGMKSRVQRGRRLLRKAFEDCCSIALDARGRVIACEPRASSQSPSRCGCDQREQRSGDPGQPSARRSNHTA